MATSYGVYGVSPSVDGTLKIQPPVTVGSAVEAKRTAEFLAGALGGAVAFAREIDPRTGATKDGVIIGRFGLLAEHGEASSEAA